MKVSVIMASFLQMPQRQKLDLKFKRAVNSFLKQTHDDKELIIVSDGCDKTIQIYEENFRKFENIKLLAIPKQPLYSGNMRNVAYDIAEGDIVTYLDADDVMGKNHLKTIVYQFDFNECDFVYYDDWMALDATFQKLHKRIVEPRYGSIGTSSISHKNPRLLNNGEKLKFTTGYGHDFIYVMKMASLGYRYKKLDKMPEYIVCHYQGMDV